MMTSPPLPPSPPDGPPRGTNFSRRKARQPFPPSPAFTRIVVSSMNMLRERLQRISLQATAGSADDREPTTDSSIINSLRWTGLKRHASQDGWQLPRALTADRVAAR